MACDDPAELKQALVFLKGTMKAKEEEMARLREEKDSAIESKYRCMASLMTEIGGLKKEKEHAIEKFKIQKEEIEKITRKLAQVEKEKEALIISKLNDIMVEMGGLKKEVGEQGKMLVRTQKEKEEEIEQFNICKEDIEKITRKLNQVEKEREALNVSKLNDIMVEMGRLKKKVREQGKILVQAQKEKEKEEEVEHVNISKKKIENITRKLMQVEKEKEAQNASKLNYIMTEIIGLETEVGEQGKLLNQAQKEKKEAIGQVIIRKTGWTTDLGKRKRLNRKLSGTGLSPGESGKKISKLLKERKHRNPTTTMITTQVTKATVGRDAYSSTPLAYYMQANESNDGGKHDEEEEDKKNKAEEEDDEKSDSEEDEEEKIETEEEEWKVESEEEESTSKHASMSHESDDDNNDEDDKEGEKSEIEEEECEAETKAEESDSNLVQAEPSLDIIVKKISVHEKEKEHSKQNEARESSVWTSSRSKVVSHRRESYLHDSLNCAPLKSGTFEWRICVVEGNISVNSMRLGVITSSMERPWTKWIGNLKKSWGYQSNGTRWHDGKEVFVPCLQVEYFPKFKSGCVIHFVLDLTERGKLSVSVDESPLVEIFSDMKSSVHRNDGFIPATSMPCGNEIKLLDFKCR